jgi:hypothetical protein
LESARNLGLYIGLLRDCFCVPSAKNPLRWAQQPLLYRGADFPPEVIADYARRENENIWWQGFTSASATIDVALRFQGSLIFEISNHEPVVSVSEVSAFPEEDEFILSPYQRCRLNGIRRDDKYNRYMISVHVLQSSRADSWLMEL